MIRAFCFVITFITSTVILAQKKLTLDQVEADYKVFESVLQKSHPALYAYVDNYVLDSIFTTTKETLDIITTDIELFKKLQHDANHIKDGHLLLFAPNTINKTRFYFPLVLKIIQKDFYTDTDDYTIPVGSKIISINKKDSKHILEDLKKYAPSDGYNLTRKYRDIESKFGLFYIYEYGITEAFDIAYIEPTGEKKSISLPAESFVSVKHKSARRNSYFSKFHEEKNATNFLSEYINNKKPFVYYKNKQKTAVLVVNTFGIETTAFKHQLAILFKEINKKKIKHLIVDIRQNNGGYRPNSIHLFSYLTKSLFKQQTSTYVSSLHIPEKEHVKIAFANEKDFLHDKYYHHPVADGWKLNFDDLETMMVPIRDRFEGSVYVLTSGSTFSTGAVLALLAKNDPDILVVGEETGGGYHFRSGDFPVYYELPNSKIIMALSIEKTTHFTKDKTVPKGSGVIPDRKVLLTVDDLISGIDTQLIYILKLIKGG